LRSSTFVPVFALAATVLWWYVFTLAPSLVWADGGRLQSDAVTGASLYYHFPELAGVPTDGWPFERLGIAAWDHPLWVMLGHGLVRLHLGDPATMLNLFSAVPATIAVVGVFLVVRRLADGSAWAGAAGAIALAISQVFWFHAVTAEVYALHALFMVTLIGMGLFWDRLTPARLALFSAVSGLGLANHVMLAATALPVAGFLLVRHVRRQASGGEHPPWWSWAGAPALFALGLTPWWLQFARTVRVAGLETAASLAAGFPWLADRWPGPPGELPQNAVEFAAMLLYQYGVGVAIGIYGAVRLWRRQRSTAALLFTLFGLHATFSANYQVADRFAFHLPSYVVFAIVIGYGVAGLLERWSTAATRRSVAGLAAFVLMAAPVAAYAVGPDLVRATGRTGADLGIPDIGDRDGLEYFLDPNQRGDDSAARYGRDALAGAAPGALVLLAWPAELESYVTMRYFQLTEHRRTDVQLELMLFTGRSIRDSVLMITSAERGCRPLYLASVDPRTYPIDELRRDFTIVAEGELFRLAPIRPASGACPRSAPVTATLDELVRSVRR
jgi:hypothetical protein